MKITTEHALSSYGIPVIVNDAGTALTHAEGIAQLGDHLWPGEIKRDQNLEIAQICGVSRRSVDNWRQGRRSPSAGNLNALAAALEDALTCAECGYCTSWVNELGQCQNCLNAYAERKVREEEAADYAASDIREKIDFRERN